MTQARYTGTNPDAAFTKKTGSRLLFYRDKELVIKAENRKNTAKFSRVDVGGGAFVWAPSNVAGQSYLASLSETERDDFLYHSPPPPRDPATKPESHRVVDGRPIKGLPNGHREGDYFDANDGTCIKGMPKRKVVSTHTTNDRDDGPTEQPSQEYINDIRSQISSGTF